MINLNEYNIKETKDIIYSDLVCLANISSNSVNTKVIRQLNNTTILIEGIHNNLEEKYAVAKEEIVRIISYSEINGNTQLIVERQKYGTKLCTNMNGFKFRTVEVFHKDSQAKLLKYDFEDSIGSLISSLFPCEVSTGSLYIQDKLENWSPYSTTRKYKVKNKHSLVYIFKGVNTHRVLKNVALVTKIGYNTRGKQEANKIKLTIKNILSNYYDKNLAINQQLKGIKPKEFFKTIFNLTDDFVYFAEGVTEESFIEINNLHTKEYKTYADILKAYCSNGVRFCFDRFERVKIFSDFKVNNITSQKTFKYNITDTMLDESNQLIFNKISTNSVERKTLINFEDLNNKYVEFYKTIPNSVNSNTFISKDANNNYTVNDITITDEDLFKSVQLKDYVLFKQTQSPFKEFYARVLDIQSPNIVKVVPIFYDKDYLLLHYGKYEYLYNLLNDNNMLMDLHYVREELPIVFKFTRNKGGKEVDSNLSYPLLPKIDGETKYHQKITAEFGCAKDLPSGSYSGITEEVNKIYGTWNSTNLLYNMEKEQFSNEEYPPIFALSNECNSRVVNNTEIINYTSFDNRNLEIKITKPTDDTSKDAVIDFTNLNNINSAIDLYEGQEISRIGNRIIEIENPNSFHVGDVLIVNKNENSTFAEQKLWEDTLQNIRWTIFAKNSVNQEDGSTKYYIYLDSNFPKLSLGEKYTFTKFPNTSIVYLQEFYFRGNPVISYTQEVTGISSDITDEGETSIDIYGEKPYSFDAKQLDRTNLKLLMGYILDNFTGVSTNTTKFEAPIELFNGIDVEPLDIISVIDTINIQVTENIKWLVTSVRIESNTNKVKVKLININSSDAEPYDIEIKEVLSYEPIEIPEYNHTGGEGDTEKPNDGTGGTDKDKVLGQFWLSEVPKEDFSAYVESFDGKYIYLKSFYGDKKDDYLSKLFPVSEFGLRINGEVFFVQSDENYRVFIKKRGIYDTEEVIITPEQDVTFLVTTSYTDVDGTLYSRKVNFGDGDNYLKVDPITGVKVQGDFVIGENNKTEDNDLYNAFTKTYLVEKNLEEGRFVINQNTIFNGDANFISQGNDEFIQINGGSIDFYRNDTRLTNLKNIRFGSITTDSIGSGVISFEGFKQPMLILPTPKRADFDQNIASFFCYTELIDPTLNTYKFYLGATSEYHLPPTDVTQEGTEISFSDALQSTWLKYTCTQFKHIHTINKFWGEVSEWQYSGGGFTYSVTKKPIYEVILNKEENNIITEFSRFRYSPTLTVSPTSITVNSKILDKELNALFKFSERTDIKYSISINVIESYVEIKDMYYGYSRYEGSDEDHMERVYYQGSLPLISYEAVTEGYFGNFSVTANAETSVLTDSFGHGVVNYIAMEIE